MAERPSNCVPGCPPSIRDPHYEYGAWHDYDCTDTTYYNIDGWYDWVVTKEQLLPNDVDEYWCSCGGGTCQSTDPITGCYTGADRLYYNNSTYSWTSYEETNITTTGRYVTASYTRVLHQFIEFFYEVRKYYDNDEIPPCSKAGETYQLVPNYSFSSAGSVDYNSNYHNPSTKVTIYNDPEHIMNGTDSFVYEIRYQTGITDWNKCGEDDPNKPYEWTVSGVHTYSYYKCSPCTDEDVPFPPKDQENYTYSEPIMEGQRVNCPTADAIETAYIDCQTMYRCKYKDDCTERDKPFPPITDENCMYIEAWKDNDPDADEKHFDCIMNNEWKPTGWTRLTDGTCHDTYDYTDGDIEHARIDCEDWSACKKCTYHTWNNNSNPNIRECWNWQPGDPTYGKIIYIPQPVQTDPYDPGHEYPYEPPDFPPYPDFPPFPDYPPYDPEDPVPPIPWNPWPPYDPNPDDPNDYKWCDCDIKNTVSNNCGCFEKPVQNSGLSCSGYFPKTYKRWAAYFCYNNSEDTL